MSEYILRTFDKSANEWRYHYLQSEREVRATLKMIRADEGSNFSYDVYRRIWGE